MICFKLWVCLPPNIAKVSATIHMEQARPFSHDLALWPKPLEFPNHGDIITSPNRLACFATKVCSIWTVPKKHTENPTQVILLTQIIAIGFPNLFFFWNTCQPYQVVGLWWSSWCGKVLSSYKRAWIGLSLNLGSGGASSVIDMACVVLDY